MNYKKIEELIREILYEIEGTENLRNGIIDTPHRVAKMYEEIFCGYNNNNDKDLIKIFIPTYNNEEIVISKGIKFYSMCEHHILPFYGKVDIAYLSSGKLIGISKLSRIVDKFSSKLNIQEQMTNDICEFIYNSELKPKAVMVIAKALHMCEIMRGVKKDNAKMITSSMRGTFLENMSLRNEILQLLKR